MKVQDSRQSGRELLHIGCDSGCGLTPSIFNSSDSAVELGPHVLAHQASSHSMRVENGAHSLMVISSVPSAWEYAA